MQVGTFLVVAAVLACAPAGHAQSTLKSTNFHVDLPRGWKSSRQQLDSGLTYYRIELPGSPIDPVCSLTEDPRDLSRYSQDEINASFRKQPLGKWTSVYAAASLGTRTAPPAKDIYWDTIGVFARSRIASYYPGKDGISEYRFVGAMLFTQQSLGTLNCSYPTRPPVGQQGDRPYEVTLDPVLQGMLATFRPK